MSKRRRQDSFGRRARREGYAARSVYKLEEIDRRVRLFRRGQRVLDLGASPGSWSQYAAERVTPEGSVLGIDLEEIPSGAPNCEFRVADAFATDPTSLDGPFDVVLSDMAPKTTGQRHADQYRSYELVMRALVLATAVLKPGGTLVAKIFQGAEFDDARAAIRAHFEKVRVIRPKATRDASYEVFLVGLGYLPSTA